MRTVFLYLLLAAFLVRCDNNNKTGQKTEPPVQLNVQSINDSISFNGNERARTAELICPGCGHAQKENLPDETCLIRYTCKGCSKDIYPKKGDCCVFCSYGSEKCPSKQ